MARVEKFTHDAMNDILRHNNREIASPTTNKDIDKSKSHLNHTYDLNHGNLSDYDYYKKLLDDKYIYGRGTRREKDTVTACGWVVTAPKEICGNKEKEQAFFDGTVQFLCNRYGEENFLNIVTHYDELGEAPHLHGVFCPVTTLDHERIHYRTVKTTKAVRLESGRYEYEHRFKLDKDGNKIKVKNYARMSDYYDEKISANDVLNKIEMKNFHKDLQKYLEDNGIEGKVLTGTTSGVNFTVKELKDFTQKTGLTLDDVKEMQAERSLLQSYVEQHEHVDKLESLISDKNAVIENLRDEILNHDKTLDPSDLQEKLLKKDEEIKSLSNEISEKDQQLIEAHNNNIDLHKQLKEYEIALEEKQREVDKANDRISELDKDNNISSDNTRRDRDWNRSSSWGNDSHDRWGRSTTNDIEETRDL